MLHRRRSIQFGHLALLLGLFGLLSGPSVRAEESVLSLGDYRLGDGYRVGDSGLTLGGYATLSHTDRPHSPERTALDNTSLFVWWEGQGHWKFFSEFDYENILSSRNAVKTDEDRYLALERLYFDYAFNNAGNVRIGKFLTPIGRWNLIHATPLVWTTSRPLITNMSFPTNVTGLMINGTLPGIADGIDYAFYASAGNELRPSPTLDPFNEVLGTHFNLPIGEHGQIGFSYAAFEQQHTRGEQKQLLGLDFLWSYRQFEVSGEGVYRLSDNGSASDEKGAFLQLVAPLTGKLYAVGRYELYRRGLAEQTTALWVTGLNYRISRGLVLKTEWVSARHNVTEAPEGLMSSISILF